jgi:integrase
MYGRAIEHGNLVVAETLVRELGHPTLLELLDLTALIAAKEPHPLHESRRPVAAQMARQARGRHRRRRRPGCRATAGSRRPPSPARDAGASGWPMRPLVGAVPAAYREGGAALRAREAVNQPRRRESARACQLERSVTLVPRLRHTFASLLIVGLKLDPKQVAGQMGHKNPSTTLDTYLHLFKQTRHAEDMGDAMSARFATLVPSS